MGDLESGIIYDQEQPNYISPLTSDPAMFRAMRFGWNHIPSGPPFPFHKLPTELLIAIFQAGRSLDPTVAGFRPLLTPPFSMCISQVCRIWREIALDTGLLWTDIRIYSVRIPEQRRRAQMYMERSKSSLLDVSLFSHGTSEDAMEDLHKVVSTNIAPAIARIRRLTIFAEDEVVLRFALSALSHLAAPCLQMIRFSMIDSMGLRDFDEDNGTLVFPLFEGGAPLLRRVQLNSIPCFSKQSFGMLTSLSFLMNDILSPIELEPFLDMLNTVSGTLVELRVSETHFMSAENSQSLIEFPQLKSLHFCEVINIPFPRAPSLETLHLELMDDTAMVEFCSLFNSPSFTNLLSLKLDGIDLSIFKDETTWPHAFPALSELELWECENESALLRHLQEHDFIASGGRRGRKKGKGKKQANVPVATLHSPGSSSPTASSSHPIPSSKGLRVWENPLMIPNLRFLTITDEHCWPVLQHILENRIRKSCMITRLRCTKPAVHQKMSKWLKKRNIQYEVCACEDFEASRMGPEDYEWMKEEERFEEDADEDFWSDGESAVDDEDDDFDSYSSGSDLLRGLVGG